MAGFSTDVGIMTMKLGEFVEFSPAAAAGKLRVLAVMSEKPSSSAPDVPTIAAAGFPGMEGEGWVGALAPMGTPKEVIALLNKHINEIITLPESKEKFAQLGL